MAKPIRATPQLKGEEVEKFVRLMIKIDKSKINKVDKNLVKQIKQNSPFFTVH